ncbi:MAG: hydrogenase/urease maturation nickel metallochaperone HypA [Bauldia litoralis]
MHEASLMKNLMAKIDAIADQENARRVVAVSVWLGALSHMTEEHFGEHFRHSSAGTRAEGARIDATLSDDPGHANAQDVLLESVEVET